MKSGDATPPLILVVDDELALPESLADVRTDRAARLRQEWLAARRNLCAAAGLAEDPVDVTPETIARVAFFSPVRWQGDLLRLDPALLVDRLEALRVEEPPGPALVLLDLQFNYGRFDQDSGQFSQSYPDYGADVLLPTLQRQYGEDASGPGPRWCAYPVVIFSARPKAELDPLIRKRGARGMIPKPDLGRDTPALELHRVLAGYLDAHGLLPDPRGRIVGGSLALLNALARARRAAASGSSVLILGESGTGKELLARYIHDCSTRRSGPYLVFHAAGRGDDLQEDELFGHWAGAFTGASADRPGLLEEADGGTLFLDEIGDVGTRVQNLLMRPLQERRTQRMGRARAGTPPADVPIDVKFVFATNKNLETLAGEGRFKTDLLQRLEEVTVTLPPLRERRDDIPELSLALLRQIDRELTPAGAGHQLDAEAVDALRAQPFTAGNVRELRNVLLRAALARPHEPRLTAGDVTPAVPTSEEHIAGEPPGPSRPSLEHRLEAMRRWTAEGPERMAIGAMREASNELAGAAPEILVALLEVSCTVTSVDGRFSLSRMMCHFWGLKPGALTSQQARRSLERLFQVEWAGRAVARLAAGSSRLRAEPSVARVIRETLRKVDDDAE